MARFVGIDVQVKRPCCYAVSDEDGVIVGSGWFRDVLSFRDELERRFAGHALHVGIDACRVPLTTSRPWYWDRSKGRWRPKTHRDKGYGRHCEVVISALGLARPQWTPTLDAAPEWMKIGFSLFKSLDEIAVTHEAFPSAIYTLLHGNTDIRLTLDFSQFAPGPKDMLDACLLAASVRRFASGHGAEVGGGDGLGTIILPGPVPENSMPELFRWPGK
ncbi:hypothetical protein [Desulfoluna spongiiphila]|uniref:DUF429 domain-containing protein n=1 Tax=Desulfoluna spongiiphila TaxID=419481 RepID=A0A1G5I7W9_9BACT|nr:hypothetical protein [Desulfoluna spongiiphila]SCY72255.1 hypothetical protein SAMN05216233_11851 [Desulfoluna spongiiphila]